MDYLTARLDRNVRALATSHEYLVRETSQTAQKVEVLEGKTKELAQNHKYMADYIGKYVVTSVNRDDSLEITMDTMRTAIERMQQRIDQLEQAPSVTKRRRRVTICAS